MPYVLQSKTAVSMTAILCSMFQQKAKSLVMMEQ